MSVLDDLFPKRAKKREEKLLSQPATKRDLNRLRVELKETPEEKEELEIYAAWMRLNKAQQKEKWMYFSIKQRNRLSQIISERSGKVGK